MTPAAGRGAPSTGEAPSLSVVLCTGDDPDLLPHTLESLCVQTMSPDAFEVVLVDRAPGGSTRAATAPFETRLPLRVVQHPDASVAAGLRRGISLARGDLVLFLDDADVADPALLEAHARAHARERGREVAVLGHTRLAPGLAADPLMRFADLARLLFAHPGPGDVLDFTHLWAGRWSCRRAALLPVGKASEADAGPGCEYVQLALRLSRRGLAVFHEPAAVAMTLRLLSFDDLCRRMEVEGRARLLLSRAHPDEAVRRWTEVSDAFEVWQRLGPAYDLLARSGRRLDRIARLRLDAGLGMSATDVGLLYETYRTVLRASRAKGIVESAATPSAVGAR